MVPDETVDVTKGGDDSVDDGNAPLNYYTETLQFMQCIWVNMLHQRARHEERRLAKR